MNARAMMVGALYLGAMAGATAADPVTPALWPLYRQAPNTCANIPNCSYAGYAYGEVPTPALPAVVTATEFGAVGDGKTDCTKAINDALAAAAAKGGGAVVLPAGRYLISGVLFIHDNGVVLRGEGPEKTTIYCSKSLQEAIGPNSWAGGKSGWSWSGGMVWIVPRERQMAGGKAYSARREGWMRGKALATVTAPAQRGATTLTVADASDLHAGDRVLLSLRDPGDASLFSDMAGEVPGTATYNWQTEAAGVVHAPEWVWPVEIARVAGNEVTLRQPLRTDARLAWQPRFLALGPVVRNSGVEELTMQMAPAKLSAHLENPGWNGIAFENAWDCWARNVVVRDTDNGIGTTASKCITVDGFRVTGRNCHHATYCRVGSHDILWTRFVIECPVHHGINVEGLSSGNVWSAGDMWHGTFDSHRALPFDNLRTDITICNDGSHGGAGGAGPLFGARFCHWNVRITNGKPDMIHVENMMPRGAVVGIQGATTFPRPYPDFTGDLCTVVEADGQPVRPMDLHLAQLALRLGRIPYHLGRPIEVALHRQDGTRLLVTWQEPFTEQRQYVIARSENDGAWNEAYATVDGPTTRYLDTAVKPGARYAYRVRAITEVGPGAWSTVASIVNRPAAIPALRWEEADGIHLQWNTPEDTAGTVTVDRREAADGAPWTTGVARLDVGQTSYVDTDAQEGKRYVYRLTTSNPSGTGDPVEIAAFRSAAGTTMRAEPFAVAADTALSAAETATGAFGAWHWVGVNGDRQPSLVATEGSPFQEPPTPGYLAWPITPIGARSFVYTEEFRADLAGAGARVHFDYQNAGSQNSTHQVGICLRQGDGTWIVSEAAYTDPRKGWFRREDLLADQTWFAFDPQAVAVGAKVEKPDLAHVTGFGFYVSRPINNRFLWLDNVMVWGRF